MKNYRFLEIICGLICIIVASVFVFYVYNLTNSSSSIKQNYTIKAKFNNIGPLHLGAQIFISGIKVGTVSAIILDQTDYTVEVSMSIINNTKIPSLVTASIESDGFFGKNCIRLYPNTEAGNISYLKDNQYIENTKDWESIEDKIGNFFFSK